MFKNYTDKRLIEGIRSQNSKVLRYIYDTWFGMVEDYIMRNGGTSDEVSDIFQETMIIVYKRVCENSVNLTSDFKGFFFGVARVLWKEAYRTRNNDLSLSDDIAEDPGTDDLYGQETDSETLGRIVARCMTQLTPKCRVALLMIAQGATNEEIARALDFPGTDRVHKHRNECKERLMELIKRDDEYRDDLV